MTADPAIAAALREATFAGCNAATRGRCVCRRLADEEPCPDDNRHAAAAIEAFHMKLATYYRGHGIEPTAMFHDSMAAAVARAAKENGHG